MLPALIIFLAGCAKVPFVVVDPPGPVPGGLAAPAVPSPLEVLPGVASTIEAKTAGTAKLKLSSAVVGLAPFGPVVGQTQLGPTPGSKLLRGLLEAGFRNVVDLGVAPGIAATVQRTSGGDQVKLEGSMATLMRYARLSKADYLVVVADAYSRPVTRSLEVYYTMPAEIADTYRTRYTLFAGEVASSNADWTTKEQGYTETFRAATADYEARGGKYVNLVIKNEGQRKKEGFDDFLNEVARYRTGNAKALESLPTPEGLAAAVKERKEVRDVKMTEVHLTIHVVSPPGGDLLRIIDIEAVQDNEMKALDVAVARLVDELKNL